MQNAAYPMNSRLLVPGRNHPRYDLWKRVMDVTITGALLLVLWPLFLLIAILVKLDSPGPVLFKQQRVGAQRHIREGKPAWEIRLFPVYKFRSMFHNADQSLHREHIKAFVEGRMDTSGSDRPDFKLKRDPRVTRVGRILRRTSLDELPQLLNVLRGEMSLVGPRPVPEYEVAEYREAWQYDRLATLPGISGLWQVYGRSQVSFEQMVLMDIEYIERQSLWLDFKILLLTIPAVLKGAGAG